MDDYNAILLEALADRLAEAFAERMHERVRHDFWGYAPDEHLKNPDLIAEKYVGIRPAPGYPACPDHTEKALLWDLLQVEENTGMELTESMAMWPGASVSGWYFSHPQSQYFVVGRLGRDQVEDYAERKGWTLAEAERWLVPEPRLPARGLSGQPVCRGAPPVRLGTGCQRRGIPCGPWFPPSHRAAHRTSSSVRCSTGSARSTSCPPPPSPAAARGTLVHAVLERLFDLPGRPSARRRPPQALLARSGRPSSSRSPSSPR